MERIDYLKKYYENYDENSRLERRRGQVEFLTTVHYIDKYLKEGMKILEIGAGTGRYSHFFARNGYKVDAVELIEHNIEILKANTKEGECINIQQGDAVDLKNVKDDEYDITLLLGPMYHLYTDGERKAAISEAIRVTKRGGIIFAAYVNNDMTVYQFCFGKGNIFNERYKKLIDFDTYKLSSTPEEVFALYRKSDIDELMREFNVKRLHYIGTDMLTLFIAEAVDAMDDTTFNEYMRYHLCICERPDMIGATHHMLDIFRKDML